MKSRHLATDVPTYAPKAPNDNHLAKAPEPVKKPAPKKKATKKAS